MIKRLIYLSIPVLIISGYVITTWVKIVNGEYFATWQHYAALGGALILIVLILLDRKACLFATGLFLVAGITGGLSLTPSIEKTSIGIGNMHSPYFNLLCLGLFMLYVVLNLGTFMDMYEARKAKKKT